MFNLVHDSWLHVVDMTNTEHTVSIRDALVYAHKYKRLAENQRFPILRRLEQRLLEAFIIDIFHVSNDTVRDLLACESFDKEEIDKYIKECEESGISFDIFDSERPFLQTNKKDAEKIFKARKSISIAAIHPRLIGKTFFHHCSPEEYGKEDKGITHSYYDDVYQKSHHIEDSCCITFEEYVELLLLKLCIAGWGGSGYVPGLMCRSVPPILYHLDILGEQENLFTDILLNIGVSEDTSKGKPLWKWDSYSDGRDFIANTCETLKVPHLTGLFFPMIYIYPDLNSIDYKAETISRIYKVPIKWSDAKDRIVMAKKYWMKYEEPSIATTVKKTDDDDTYTSGLTFSGTNRAWLDMKVYANYWVRGIDKKTDMFEVYPPKVIASLRENRCLSKFNVELTAYYLSMEKAEYKSQGRYQCSLPHCVLFNEDKNAACIDFIFATEAYGNRLKKNIKKIYDNIEVDYESSVMFNTGNRFMRICEGIFKNEFLPAIDNLSSPSEIDILLEEYKKRIRSFEWNLLTSIPIPDSKCIIAEGVLEKIKKGVTKDA